MSEVCEFHQLVACGPSLFSQLYGAQLYKHTISLGVLDFIHSCTYGL